MKKNLLSKHITLSETYDSLIKECMKNHVVLYNYALSLLHDDNYISLRTLQNAVKSYIFQHNVYPIIKSSLFIEIYYLYKKFNKGIKNQKNITSIQYLTFVINNLQEEYIKININKKEIVMLKIVDFLDYDEYISLNNKVKFINLSYSNKNNNHVLAAFA